MPQFDPGVIAPQLFWLVITFGIFYLVMARLGLPGVSRVLEERVERVAEDRDQAESLRHESEMVSKARDAALAEARQKAADALAAAEVKARAELTKKLASLDAALGDKLSAAEARILDAREAAQDEIAAIAGEACRLVVARLADMDIPAAAADKAIAALDASKGKGA